MWNGGRTPFREAGLKACGCVLLLLAAQPAFAQGGAECAVVECARAPETAGMSAGIRRLWTGVSQAHAAKIEFVEAIRRFAMIQGGPIGHDAAGLADNVAAMRTALSRWDRALRELDAAAAPQLRDAEAHVALGTAYLDRHRVADAVRELAEAAQIDDRRTDTSRALALAYAQAGKVADAARTLRTAAGIDAHDPVIAYEQLALSRQAQRADELVPAAQRVARLRGAASLDTAPVAPFERAELLRQPAGVAPVFPQARYADAFQRIDAGNYTDGADALAQAAASDPFVANEAGVSGRHRLASASLRGGSSATAITMLEALAREEPQSSEVHRLLGLAVWTAGDQNRAIQELRLAIERRPDDERARLQLALVLRASDRPSEAESELRAAIERLPQSGQARYQLGQLLESQSRLREAASAYAETTAHPPVVGRDYLYQRLARVRVNQADFEGAIAAYAARVAVNPNSGEAHRSLGEIYFLQGRDDEAVAELLVAVWLDPRDSRALAALGKAFVRGERYADAVPVLRRVVAIDAARADAHYALGQALLRLRQPDEGRREIEEFQRLEAAERERGQRDFRIEQWRGDAARSMSTGDLAGALAVLQRIRQEDPENPRWVREVGITLLRARRFDDSVAALEAAQARQPTLDGARLLADAYAAAGRPAESRQHLAQYQQALEAARLDQLLTMNLGS